MLPQPLSPDPSVYLISHSQPGPDYLLFLEEQASNYSPDASFADALCELSGRVCYDSFANRRPGGNSAYLQRIKEAGHGEVIEHSVFTFFLDSISRSCLGQLTRYRAGFSFCVRSSRFCNEASSPFLFPSTSLSTTLLDQLLDHERQTRLLYSKIQDELATSPTKIKNQAARYILPQGTATSLVMTCNARSLRHALEQRCSLHADYEIRLLFNRIYNKVKHLNLFADYTPHPQEDGTFTLSTDYRKV